ncbi:MAG: sulfite exporter TauE/SafE family protein, partial [Actinobacteria bacterium]|nr:sulfite exporter TauE/SafE family protein [Actinomycetota bacterium]
MVDLDILIWLALAALVAGWVDAVAGGGGLLQVPALLLGLPGPGVQALGTNKVASVFGTAAATASSLPEDVFRPVIIALLVAAWIWVAVSPTMGSEDRLRFAGR